MTSDLTPTQRLAEIVLAQPLADYVADKRNAHPKWSWQSIAAELSLDTQGAVNISREALRGWYGEQVAA